MIHKMEADSIKLEFNGRKILSDIHLKCETGKITGLLGTNGAGKSCLMKIIYGDLKCEKSIRFDNMVQNEAYKKSGLILFLPQFSFVPKFLSLKRIFKDFELDFSHFSKRFPEFTNRYKSSVGSLSNGGYRLIELYVILKSESQFAVLDEPFTHLSPIQIENVKELLIETKAKKGLLMTDHMYMHITDICDSLYILSNGKIHLTKSNNEIETFGYARLNDP